MDGLETLLLSAGEASRRAQATAARVREVADGVRALAAEVQAVEDTPWRSVAAGAFRVGVRDLAATLRATADRVDRGADALAAHGAVAGARAEHLEGLLRSLEHSVDRGLDDAARWARRALDDALPAWRP